MIMSKAWNHGLNVVTLSTAIEPSTDGKLPTEFRIFVAGWNDTSKGRFLFDSEAAASVMASYKEHGVDLMIDLEHQSLDDETPEEPTARDARGWCKLALKDDGSLWAVDVTWTPDGTARLKAKSQRYISPAFTSDRETRRVTGMVNVAITGMPATHHAQALVAAAARGGFMTVEEFLKVIKALGIDLSTSMEDALAKIRGEDSGGSEDDAAPSNSDVTQTEAAAPPGDAPDNKGETKDEKKEEVAAASARLMRLTGKDTFVGMLDEVEVWRRSHLRLESETEKLAKERRALESAKRKENAVTLTKLGAETPHTTGLAKGSLCKRLMDEPLEEQNARVAALLAARGGKIPAEPKPPPEKPAQGTDGTQEQVVQTPNGPVTLSARDLQIAKELNRTPEEYASMKRK